MTYMNTMVLEKDGNDQLFDVVKNDVLSKVNRVRTSYKQ
jgi:hypothetical protein